MTGLVDLGAALERPVALVVLSPGLAPSAANRLARALEKAGWDAWDLDLAATEPQDLCSSTLPGALSELEARGPVLIVGEGLGGRIAARCVEQGALKPAGLALLGAPLDLAYVGGAPVALVAWMADLPVPSEPLDLGSVSAGLWRALPALPLLLGEPLPALGSLSPQWLTWLGDEVRASTPISLVQAPCPVLAAASPSDNLGPPESMRWRVPEGSFVRLGLLHLDGSEPDHAGLLTDPAPARVVTRWARRILYESSEPGVSSPSLK